MLSIHDDQNLECPLCMEPFEMDDFNFFPCTCGYQICRFCWHRIRTDENGLCPACRKQYPEDPADFKPLSVEEWQKIKNEKRQKDQLKKQKMSESRKHLANVRVVQKNLVFVVGLPARLADSEVLKKFDYFGKFGKIHKVVVNQSPTYAGSQVTGPSASAYVTYCRPEDALKAIKSVNNIQVDGRTLKASLGTTKYCSHFLKNQQCPKTDCMYLHELGDEAASFTKEDMQQGKHQEYEKKLQDQILGSNNRKQTVSPPPPQISSNSSKESWPCTVQNTKESRSRTKDSSQSQKAEGKSSRSKNKHSSDGQKSKKSKNKNSESVQSSNVSKNSTKEDSSAQRKSQKNKHKESSTSSAQQTSGHSSTQQQQKNETTSIETSKASNRDASPCEIIAKMNSKNAQQTTYVHITDQQPKPVSASIKINPRSDSPVLPPSPISSSSSSLFTPFGSLSSNFLSSSSPSPPPSSSNPLSFGSMGGSSNNLPEDNPNIDAFPSLEQHQKSQSPNHLFGSNCNSENESLFSHMNYIPSSTDCNSYNGQLHSEEISNANNREWSPTYSYEDTQKLEDDLDFDPWNESNKGLADLIAKENVAHQPTYQEMQTPPGFFQPIKPPVPNQQRISVPPPGFCSRQVPQTNSLNHLPGMYDPTNTNFIPCKLPTRQSVNGYSHYYQQEPPQNPLNITNQFKQQIPPHIARESLIENLRKKTMEERFRNLLPEVLYNLNTRNMQKTQNQNGPSWNTQPREFPWMSNNESQILNPGNIADRNNAQMWMKALQQLTLEDNTNQFNGHSSFVNPFALRGQWPTAQCPPPGFVAPNRSPVNTPFQHMQVNQKI